jgi:type I restriction enzyme R subunit
MLIRVFSSYPKWFGAGHFMLSEAETRKKLVEKALLEAGWGPLVDYVPGMSWGSGTVREYETDNGPADYILFHDGVPLAVVESKKLSLSPQNVLVQAQRCSRGFRGGPFNFEGFRIPFVYSTNGELFWFQDLREVNSRSRKVAKFHTHAALQEFLSTDTSNAADWLRRSPNTELGLRPYQRKAVESVENALLENRRSMLVAMATGTGKTYVAAALIYSFNFK